jgi:transcriptional regulator with XRE-family HTH domain
MSRALGARIRELRREAGYDSIEAFARALNYSWPTVSRYERGVSTPSLARLREIAALLDVSLEELLNGREDEAA